VILVDSSIWVDWFRGKSSILTEALDWILEQRGSVAICGLIETEILQGVRSQKEEMAVREAFGPFTFLEPSRKTYAKAAELFRTARQKGYTIRSTIDCVIASVALEWGADLLENDRDYEQIAKVSALRLLRKNL